jgi:hypothetical protein
MFPNEAGQPINCRHMVQRDYMPALKKAKITRIKIHCLRHTFAHLLVHQGENITYVQSQLGALVAHGEVECLSPRDETGQSSLGLLFGKDHFGGHWSLYGHK